ncbi:hypothetical protein HD806DRAFT_549935 [Xylariaceae sp. AK1471]|nr:hypothetical protein HD806DRAFT_549935 [Xylariaceae sp. AK1471]
MIYSRTTALVFPLMVTGATGPTTAYLVINEAVDIICLKCGLRRAATRIQMISVWIHSRPGYPSWRVGRRRNAGPRASRGERRPSVPVRRVGDIKNSASQRTERKIGCQYFGPDA